MIKVMAGKIPTTEEMDLASKAQTHPSLFLKCFSAELMGEEWRPKLLPQGGEGYIIRWKSDEYEEVETDSYPFKKRVYKEEGNGLEIQSYEQAIANCEFLNKQYPERTYWHFWVNQDILNNAESEGLQLIDTVAQHLFEALSQAHG